MRVAQVPQQQVNLMNSSINCQDREKDTVCIACLGSNADSSYYINEARKELAVFWNNIQFSTPLFTEPIRLSNPSLFLNQVALFHTTQSSDEIIRLFKEIENKLGRNRADKEHITLDIDLIQYGKKVLKPKDIQYPHVQEGIQELKTNNHMKFIGIIPARYASTRFPAKPLAVLGGKPVIQRVYEQVSSILDDVYVATDDDRIEKAVQDFGGKVIMTSPDHQSGTDRCFEAYQKVGIEFDVIINIQGDEPFIQKSQIEALKSCFLEDSKTDIATLVKPFSEQQHTLEDLENPNTPKVVVGLDNSALYFSRSVIPYLRNIPKEEWLSQHTFYKHIGLYAYRAQVLEEVTDLAQTPLELSESLEQLRWLEHGYHIKVAETHIETIGIDTPHDLERAEAFLQKQLNK